MKNFVRSVFLGLASLALAGAAFADVNLQPGQSIDVNGTRVSCGGVYDPGYPAQSATSRQCAQEDMYGKCQYFNETTVTGRFCGTADVCGREDMYGKCIYFNTVAACGNNSCTTSKTCGRQDMYGNCNYFNEAVTCY
jgi:hypothetical protein